jgi:hypothetical protein
MKNWNIQTVLKVIDVIVKGFQQAGKDNKYTVAEVLAIVQAAVSAVEGLNDQVIYEKNNEATVI